MIYMFLNDIGKSPDSSFKRINHHLETNYGFKISEDASDKDLVSIMERIEDEITDLKVKGDDAKTSPEISKRLLVLEGIRNLREFAMLQFQSPDLEFVVNGLSDFVSEMFCRCGQTQDDYEDAIRDAMKHYRSSKYRFPDAMIEERVRHQSMSKIQSTPTDNAFGIKIDDPLMMEEEDTATMERELNNKPARRDVDESDFDNEGKRSSATGGHSARMPDSAEGKRALRLLNNPDLSLDSSTDDEEIPMVRDRNGRLVPDPFKAHAAALRKGIVSEQKAGLVKNLRRLLETEVSQAEVMMAAKGFAQELQEMVEKIGRLQNEDLPPVTDQMRETYGTESASAFQTQIYGALQNVMDSLYTAKGQVDDAVENMASTGQVTAEVDMDKDIDFDDAAIVPDDEIGDLDNIEADIEDEFAGAEEDEPLGRAMKASESIDLKRKVLEMQKLVIKARQIKESRK